MAYYRIAEWTQRYEVSIKGREPKNGEELRAGPLSYVRLKVYGHRQGAGYRRLQLASGDRFMEVFGIFCKLLEISGNQTRDHRGKLLNERDEPATIGDIAFLLGIPDEQVDFAIAKLCEVGWLIKPIPEISGESGTLNKHNITKHNPTQHNSTKEQKYGMAKAGASLSLDLLRFAEDLDNSLKPNSKSQRQALLNLIQWLRFQIEENLLDESVCQKILDIAKDSKSGRVPMAVFFSRLDKAIGYRARAAQLKGSD